MLAWIAGGAVGQRPVAHPAGIGDPRSQAFHGEVLRATRYRAMLDPADADACGRCHDGTLSRPASVKLAAPHASACTTCHAEPGGIVACNTCHGDGSRAYPPRDPCFFPGDSARGGAHAKHAAETKEGGAGLPCSSCHPTPGADVIGGLHGNGSVEIVYDSARVSPEASYDRATGACAVSCHDRGGARSKPLWNETAPLGCNSCHGSPPAAHYNNACTTCHAEANGEGTALTKGQLHLNGKVDLGDGSGGCGACHGKGDSAWPTSDAHPSHKAPLIADPLDCASCHPVPTALHDATHLDGTVQIAFAGRALDRGAKPIWNGATCAGVACHGAELSTPPPAIPTWIGKGSVACGSCHGIPPTQHTSSTDCGRPECHSGEVLRSGSDLSISPFGRALHVNGVLDVAAH